MVVNKTFNLRAGDELYVGGSPVGVCCYLCVPGGFQVPTLLESCSGLDPLRAGDILSCRESRVEVRGMHGPCEFMSYPNSCTLRVLPGPQHDWFPSGILGSELPSNSRFQSHGPAVDRPNSSRAGAGIDF